MLRFANRKDRPGKRATYSFLHMHH